MPTFLLSFLLRGAPYIAGAIVVGLIGTYVHHKGYAAGRQEVQAQFDTYRAEQARQSLAAEQAAREKEREWGNKFAAIDQRHQEAMKNAQAEYDKIIASLRAGAVRVRDNRAAVCGATAAVAADTGQPIADPGSTSQLSQTDTAILLQWGAEADEVIKVLLADRAQCVGELKAERQ